MSREEILRDAAAHTFPTSIGTLLEETRSFFRRYVVADDVHYDAVALWIAHSHVFSTARARTHGCARSRAQQRRSGRRPRRRNAERTTSSPRAVSRCWLGRYGPPRHGGSPRGS